MILQLSLYVYQTSTLPESCWSRRFDPSSVWLMRYLYGRHFNIPLKDRLVNVSMFSFSWNHRASLSLLLIFSISSSFTQSMNMRQEVGYRMQQTMAAWTKLKPFWKACNCTDGWKLRVYQAIIQNKLIYGLETIHLTQGMLNKINAFQLRGLRSILSLEPTFVNRRNTNQFVLRTASEKAGQEVKLFSELLLNKRVALAGHILRASDTDPLREATYCSQSADAYPIGKRRVGGPRQQWRHFTHKHAWVKFSDGRTDYDNTENQNRQIHQMALARLF